MSSMNLAFIAAILMLGIWSLSLVDSDQSVCTLGSDGISPYCIL